MDFIVTRSNWYRGKGTPDSMLLRNDQMRCCLGQVAQQCNIPDSQVLMIATPRYVDFPSRNLFPNNFFTADKNDQQDWVREAMLTNDDGSILDDERELELSRLFIANGHSIRFVD